MAKEKNDGPSKEEWLEQFMHKTWTDELVGAKRSPNETTANLTGTNVYLAATNGGVIEVNITLAKSNLVANVGVALGILAAGQQAQHVEGTYRAATELQFENAELSHEK
ncbi:hypothetical protein E8E12_004342 [Didymella heteroderae]|uniref:Uncharacterized protein n=1 Tax=Didymella heteroderae TaxID=1769908 RepID=A0A9P5C4W5_9PLEO|nr:hypothetical protein E8E12_004342 [Didymella heteroderae]